MNNYDNLLDLNLREEENRILDFIRKTVSESKKKGWLLE